MKINSKCCKCGQDLPQLKSGVEVDWSALKRARKRLRKEMGYGVKEKQLETSK
tara:strand:+ start:9830 stop:9988 length:159 start_codon:yes stop_codon:yes gene_type:complete